MFDTLKSKTMDYKSMLIGGLATALLFVSIGAGVQSEPTTIQVTENPYKYELKVNYDDATKALLLNRETGDVYYLNPNYVPGKLQNNMKLH